MTAPILLPEISPEILSLLDAALRSLVLALAVWAGLRLLRVRNVPALKSAWVVVLAAAILMPVILPFSARWPGAALVLPVVESQPAPDAMATPAADGPPQPRFRSQSNQPVSADAGVRAAAATKLAVSRTDVARAEGTNAGSSTAENMPLSLFQIAMLVYLAVAALLLLRLGYGLWMALRIWRAAEPVPEVSDGLRVRTSSAVSSPVTVGSGVILPPDYVAWGDEKLRVVLAHELSHVRQGDFYLQMLAGFYAAVVWFSPLGWWLKRNLSELGEAISDCRGLEEAASCTAYAEMLLEFAAAPRLNPSGVALIGVAMARRTNLSHRIERLLNPGAFRQAFTGSRRALVTAVLAPAVLFATVALVHVQAAGETQQTAEPASQSPVMSQAPVTGQAHPDAAPPLVAPEAAPGPVVAPDALQAPQPDAAPRPAPGEAAPAPHAAPGVRTHVDVPPIHIDVPAIHVNVPAQHFDIPAIHVNVPGTHVDVPAQHVNVPATHVDVPGQHIDIPAEHIDVPAIHVDVPAGGAQSRVEGGNSGGELYAMLTGLGHTFGFGQAMVGHAAVEAANSAATEATFDRTLTFSGTLDLHVSNGAGNIHLTRGAANALRVHARIYSSSASDAEQVQALAAHPPIEQTGNIVRIGGERWPGMNHIRIDYEIEAPADAALQAASGSGDIRDEGVGQGAKLIAGSGDIVASSIDGGFVAQTGSGNIAIASSGAGDARVQTGSGNIDVRGVRGGLKAQTGSGDIKAAGAPASLWRLQTGSGSVEFSPGSAAASLDVSTGSGSIKSNLNIAGQVSWDRHHMHGNLNGGGPAVQIQTGSGRVLID